MLVAIYRLRGQELDPSWPLSFTSSLKQMLIYTALFYEAIHNHHKTSNSFKGWSVSNQKLQKLVSKQEVSFQVMSSKIQKNQDNPDRISNFQTASSVDLHEKETDSEGRPHISHSLHSKYPSVK